ncbi:hypothetical protein B0H15DRAFT_943495 [Mycena belliarum]|uniref:Uncharacterized protein n=1 Tax=Mycena belliarum TaxID=1033014 RepID=A0AAD6UHP2_9AGAR|nr:hypothetical protein B0H15DRAFT_943495 [Mycena belliae]
MSESSTNKTAVTLKEMYKKPGSPAVSSVAPLDKFPSSFCTYHPPHPMDSFTIVPTKTEEVLLPPTNEDGGTGSSGGCVVCKEDTTLPPMNEDGGTGSSGSCVVA